MPLSVHFSGACIHNEFLQPFIEYFAVIAFIALYIIDPDPAVQFREVQEVFIDLRVSFQSRFDFFVDRKRLGPHIRKDAAPLASPPATHTTRSNACSEARALKRHARNQGYSEAQIDAFLDSRDERRRIYAQADRYMVANGVVNGQPETFCRLGQQEIAQKTIAGSLLVAR